MHGIVEGRLLVILSLGLAAGAAAAQQPTPPQTGSKIDLPSSKQLLPGVPGSPQRLNSLPISMALSPDSRWAVTVNAGYGTYESQYRQSLAVINTATGAVVDSPEERTVVNAGQTLYSGLAFSADGKHLYGSIASLTDPEGTKKKGDTGSGIMVYGFADGVLTRERLLKLPLQQLAGGRRTMLIGEVPGDKGVPYPAGIAVVPGAAERLLVSDNLSDDALLLDPADGRIVTRFDLSQTDAVPGTYPLAVAVSRDAQRGYVTLWNASEVVELDLVKGVVARTLPLLKPAGAAVAGTHPCALEFSPDGRTLYVALANRDVVAAVDVSPSKAGAASFKVKGYFDTRLPGQSYFGAEPVALALSRDGKRLFAANMGTDAVAVIDTAKLTPRAARKGMVEPTGFISTEWMPMSMTLASAGPERTQERTQERIQERIQERLFVATAKGKGTGPNGMPQRPTESTKGNRRFSSPTTYIGTLLYGSVAMVDVGSLDLPKLTAEVVESNRLKAAAETISFAAAGASAGASQAGANASPGRIHHVIYIIKENRTYDQVFGDLSQDGKPVGNGDRTLTMYGEAITPNQHKLALQFGVLDNFFDSGEVSGDGHVWSNAAIGTDYLEKTWEGNYRGRQRSYDFEGVVAEGFPIEQHIPDVNEPASGYLWGNVARHGKSLYHFGEYIASTFCNDKKAVIAPVASQEGPMLTGLAACTQKEIAPGGAIPETWGGGTNKWPWAIPLLASNTATKPELVGHFAEEAPDFNLRVPDQIRYEVFARHFDGWVKDRAAGRETMPAFVEMRLGNDHTAGTTAGGPTPASSVADNDLALGRIIDRVSHSPFWDDTAIFVLEDDAQAGGDHVDAHRSLALIISKYAPHRSDGAAVIDSRFYSTVSVLRTMETLLGLPPMNNNDAFSSLLAPEFSGAGDQPAFVADRQNQDNGLIYQANPKVTAALDPLRAEGERESAKMDFRHADRADTQKLNVILWRDARGEAPVPALLTEKRRKAKKDDDD